ncbi:hypothetical protein FRC04_004889 [Tulasnella sp. 424]|nr:hypothetical protein FRC04_004889 [Tulasnella sp. 424]KAG8975667.1 hypothetical protein FRC05_005185 [Tulasnella sp. 425]
MDASPLVFHEKFNFHDGNILMSARGSRDGLPSSPVETVHFRLHKSVLAIYSTTFADMLSMPQGDNPVENAVVHLQDHGDHVIKLLTAIYYGGSVPKEPLSRATWNFLVPVLMLADKYGMGTLAASLLPKLLEDWPITLGKWDDLNARTRLVARTADRQRQMNPSLPSPDDLLPEPAIAIKFGQAHPAARNILPAAFYHLSRLSHSTQQDSLFYQCDEEVPRSVDYGLLASADWLRVVQGQANIRRWLERFANHSLYLSWPPDCTRRVYRDTEDMDDDQDDDEEDDDEDEGIIKPCGRRHWWNTHIGPSALRIANRKSVDVLEGLKELRRRIDKIDRTETSEDDICFECQVVFVKELDSARKHLWEELPSFFHLGDYPNWGKS